MNDLLITKIYQNAPNRSVWMEKAHVKIAGASSGLTHLLAIWDDLDNPTRAEILEDIQDSLADICTTVRGRKLFPDDENKNGE